MRPDQVYRALRLAAVQAISPEITFNPFLLVVTSCLCNTVVSFVSPWCIFPNVFPPYLENVESRPNAISSKPCPALSYAPPLLIKLGQGRYALIGIHGRIAPIPPAILNY
jgi:hypothetical protein